MLDRTTFHDAAVVRLSGQLVAVKVNADKDPRHLAKKYRIDGYPTVLFLDGQGREYGRVLGSLPGRPFAGKMKEFLARWQRGASDPPSPPPDLTDTARPEAPAEQAPLPPPPPPPLPTMIPIADFERNSYVGWRMEGNCWGRGPEGRSFANNVLTGWQGNFYLTSAHPRADGWIPDSGTGRAVSDPFIIQGTTVSFRIAGGCHPDTCCLNLIVDGRTVQTATGDGTLVMKATTWDVHELLGKTAQIEIVDRIATGPKGYLIVDDIRMDGIVAPSPAPHMPEPAPLPVVATERESVLRAPVTATTGPRRWRAVVMAGGEQGALARQFARQLVPVVEYLQKKGVEVQAFLGQDSDLNTTLRALNGANIVIYCGHGAAGFDLALPGGWATRKRLRSVQLAPGAVVIMHQACFSAGDSASDKEKISEQEAIQRVSGYAETFLDRGAKTYFATNFGGGVVPILSALFAGKANWQAYTRQGVTRFGKVLKTAHPQHRELSVWVMRGSGGSFSHAFVGDPKGALLVRPTRQP